MSEQVGSIHFKADTTELERAAQALDKLAQAGPRVQSALTGAEQSVAKTGKSLATIGNSSRGLDTVNQAAKTAASGLNQAANAAEGVRTAVGRAGQSATGLDSIASGSAQATRGLNDAAASMLNLRGAIASAGIAIAAKQFIDVADSVTVLNNQLKLATGSTQAAAMAYSSLFEIAQRSRVSFTALGDTFASIARAAQPLGVSQERLLKVTESIGNAMTISGGSAQSLQAALVQLGQGLSAGTLRGEELNSVMEQAPRLAKALADGLGVTTGQLRAMGAEGEITAEKVIKALESQSSVLKGEVAGATLTVGQAFTQLGNSATYAVGELDKTIGASAAAASAVSSVASAVDVLGRTVANNEATIKAVLGFAGVVVGAKAATVAIGGVATAMAAARVATVGFTAALAANPIGAAILTATALGAAAYSAATAMDDAKASVDGVGNASGEAAKEIAILQKSADDAAAKLLEAEQRLADLERRGAKGSGNLMLREAYNDAQRLVNKLREAKAVQDSLLGAAQTAQVEGDPYNDGTQYQAWLDKQAAFKEAQQGMLEITARASGVSKQFTSDLQAHEKALAAGVISTEQYIKAVTDLNVKRHASTEAGRAEAAALRESSKGAKSGVDAYKSLAAKAADYVKTLQLEAQQGSKLTQSQKLQIELDNLLTKSKGKVNAARVAGIQASIDESKQLEAQVDAYKAAAEAAEDMLKFKREYYAGMAAAADDLAKSNEQLRNEVELIGLSEEAQHAINKAKLEAKIITEELRLAEMQRANDAVEFMSQEQILLAQYIEQLRERLALLDDKKVREGNKRAQEQMQREWDRTAQTIGDTLADYIMGGGKDAATYLKRLFSTLVLQPVVQTVVGGVLGTGAAAASGVASGGVSGLLNQLGNSGGGFTNWSSWGATSSDWLMTQSTKLGLNGMQGLGDAAYNLGNTIQGVDNWLKEIPGMDGGLGSAFGYAQAIYSLTQGNYGSAIGSAIGTYILPGIGTMIGSTLGGLVDGAFGGGTDDYGAAAKYAGGTLSNTGKQYTAQELTKSYSAGLQAPMDSLARTIGGSLDGLATLFKKQSGYSVQTGFTSDNDDPSRGIFIVQNAMGETLEKWLHYRSGEFGQRATGYRYAKDPEKGYDDYLKSVAAATVPILKDIVPTWADGMLDGLVQQLGYSGDAKDWKSIQSGAGAMESLNAVIQQIAAAQAAIESIGKTIPMFANVSEDMMSQLMTAAGGSADALTGIIGGFYNSFTSEAQKMQDLSQRLQDAVGIDPRLGDEAAAQFEAAVKEAMAGGNAALALQLMQLGPTFKQAADYAQKLAGNMIELGDALSDVMIDLLSERKSLEAELLRAQGDQSGYLDAIRAIATEGYTDAERAAWDYNTALQSQVEALDAAARAAEEAARAAEEAARAAAQAVVDAVGNAWGNLGTMSGLAAQYTGNTSGLTAQLGTVKASYAGATDTSGRVAALQQIIGLEQSIWNAQQAARQAEQQAAQKRAEAAREQLQSVNQLLSAAKGLGDYASKLFMSEQSGLSEAERLAALGSEYSSLMARAKTGDADALQDLQGISSDYLRLAEQMAASQADYSILSGTIAAELASAAAIQEAAATSQAARLERQIEAAERAAEFASAQFQVSTDTQKLIDSLLAESMLGFATEAEQMAQLITSGQMTVEGIDSLPAELAGLLNATLVPAISGIADAARAAATAAQSSASMASAAIAQAMASAAAVHGSHAGGLSYVPFDGYRAELHKGERVLTAAENRAYTQPMLQQSSNAEVVAELRALRQEHAKVVAELAEIKKSTGQFADQFDNVSAGGNALAAEVMNGGADLDLLTIYEDAKA